MIHAAGLLGSHPPLPGFLHALAPILNHYGYLAVALIVGIESFGPPLPGETIIIAASIYAGAGTLDIAAVFAIAFAAAVAGDNIGYLIGRYGGRRLVDRYGRYVGATPERFGKAEKFFVRFGGRIVIVARFVEGLRQLNGIIAGTTGMRWPKFVLCNLFGALLWVGVWTVAGYEAGDHIQPIVDAARYIAYAVVGLLIVAVGVYFARRRRRGADTVLSDNEVAPVER